MTGSAKSGYGSPARNGGPGFYFVQSGLRLAPPPTSLPTRCHTRSEKMRDDDGGVCVTMILESLSCGTQRRQGYSAQRRNSFRGSGPSLEIALLWSANCPSEYVAKSALPALGAAKVMQHTR